MLGLLARADYALRQSARVAWFTGHYLASRRGQIRAARNSGVKPPKRSTPSTKELMEDMGSLFGRDLANAKAGLYPVPYDHDGSLREIISRSRQYFSDLPSVERRRAERDGKEVFEEQNDAALPRYYQQNFHYQTDGYLSDHSAKLYDLQVEVLFTGAANAMRRQALVAMAEFMHGRDQRNVNMLDLACGTGRFLRFARQAYPRLNLSGLDLSNAYLAEAGRHLKKLKHIGLVCANAEKLPFENSSQDLVSSIFLFHELPPKIRKIVAAEIARVLKPKGRFIFIDSLQTGDRPKYDGLLELFDNGFHEPYFSTYVKEDFTRLFAAHGLHPVEQTRAFLSKVVVYEKG